MSGLRPLVVCADDFAKNEGVTDGICRLAALGRITATSAMTLSPRWRADAARLRDVPVPLDVGLHLDWTSSFAMQAGHGLALREVLGRTALRLLSPEAVRVAVERQLDAFESVWQAPPDHVDGHQHVHQMPVIRQALLAALQRRYPGHRPWVRVSASPPALADAKSRIMAAWGAAPWARLAHAQGLVVRPWLVGVYNFDAQPGVYERHLARWLALAPAGAVLMCHPASALEAPDSIAAARVQEFRCLSAPGLPDAWARAGVQAVRGGFSV
jgi:predicted glycoside hydrolase/deacetylase ChbG (UPF0249 family)